MDAVSPHTSIRLGMGSENLKSIATGRPILRDVLVCGSWNVKGLSDLKFCEIIRHMQEFDLDILCLQETWVSGSSVKIEDGYGGYVWQRRWHKIMGRSGFHCLSKVC